MPLQHERHDLGDPIVHRSPEFGGRFDLPTDDPNTPGCDVHHEEDLVPREVPE
jgi:hypothetical protein